MIINDTQNLLIHLSVDIISTVEILKISTVLWNQKAANKSKAHTKRGKKKPTLSFIDYDFYCIEWVKEMKTKWIKERLGELLFSFVAIQTCQICK